VERVTGEHLLSDQKIWHIVSDKALVVSQDIKKNVMETMRPCRLERLITTYLPLPIFLASPRCTAIGQRRVRDLRLCLNLLALAQDFLTLP